MTTDTLPPDRTTVAERPALLLRGGEGPVAIMRQVEQGDEPRRILHAIVAEGSRVQGVEDCALFLPPEGTTHVKELIAQEGSGAIAKIRSEQTQTPSENEETQLPQTTDSTLHTYDIVCLGGGIGQLVAHAPKGLTKNSSDILRILAYHAGVVHERQRLASTVQLFLDRLEVLTELNQLIAGNVGLQRIVKSITRESAFRFAADISIAWVFNEDKTALEVKGIYGCTPERIPKRADPTIGLISETLRQGGNISVTTIMNQRNHSLTFLEELGVQGVDLCCLEVRGETYGVLLLGYKRPLGFTQDDLTRYEEFCQGAAVAISNARTQERLTQYSENLESLVQKRTAELAVQTSKAEDANHAKSQFLANMSHELRTPLTAIVGYASVLAEGLFGALNDKQREALLAVSRSSEHLKNLIDDVLNLARVESGKEHTEPTRIIIKDLLHQGYKLMMQTAISKQLTLVPIQLPKELEESALWVDQRHVHQILINLLSNAVKYTPRGGKISVSAELLVDKVRLQVSDTGVGIPPHKLLKLFERFERGEDTYSKSQEGTGIGLNLTKHLVELNGGKIGVESQEGKGSTFWVLLPLAASDTKILTKIEPIENRARLDGVTALIVDDNRETCEVLTHMLTSAGASVSTAASVKEGFALFTHRPPHIVLTDLAIPGESGLSLIDKIRNSSPSSAMVPIIVMSACAFEADKDAALNAGASLFLPKPFKTGDIIKNVKNLTLTTATTSGAFVARPEL